MAYISPEQRKQKKELFDAYIYDLFLSEGWDAITYQRISKRFNTTSSSIQRYYPYKTDFAEALDGKVFPLISKHLSFEGKEAFVNSWVTALDDEFFAMVVRMLIENAMAPRTHTNTIGGAMKLMTGLSQTMTPQEAKEAIESVLGKSIVTFMNQ
jgi:hypothetical protein